MSKKKNNKNTFEDGLTKLSEIIEQIEDTQTPLDTAISLYKEGLTTAVKCGEILKQYEKEIYLLKQNADSTFRLEHFGDL